MNIIQVGRPSVSRYHQNRKFFGNGKGIGINHEVHDFPNARYGLKLGGFMLLTPVKAAPSSASEADETEELTD